ncbi:MAG TPA: histidine kinase dimerization/phospho-acceptor domain-containing protein, partial [Bdellovibrionota bacterium]|nr:histidine kinase dimerization/phospho-acceptor domain-containing protein [Bdellovibrionota bacterium]
MDILGQSALLVGMTSFALGMSVIARNVRNKLYLSFGILTTFVSAWALAFFFAQIWPDQPFYRLHLLFNIWLAPIGLGFIRVMVRLNETVSRRLLDLTVGLALCLSVGLTFGYDQLSWVLQLIYFLPAVIVLQILMLMWIDRRLRRGAKRHPKLPTVGLGRRNLIYLGGLIVLSTTVMDHVDWIGTAIPSIGNLGLTVYLFFLSQAITQQRLLNFGALISRFLVLLGIAFVLTLVYSVLVAWVEDSPALFFLNSFIASFLILMLLDPIRRLVGYFTERLLTQKHRRLQQTLREAQMKLTGVVDPLALFQNVLTTAEQVLEPTSAALYILRSEGTRFRRVRSMGEEEGGEPPREILVDHPLLAQCKRLHSRSELPIVLDQLLESEIDRSASKTQREQLALLSQSLKALGSNLVVPLMDGDRILGFLALRVPGPPEPWGSNWGLLHVIYPYFEHVAQTMKNMEVYVRQREKERLAALGEMAAGLAHEIRNPLGAIKGAAQFLDPSADRPDSRFLRIIVEETDRLNRVVTQFLDYSKPPNLDLKPIDLSQLAAKTVETLRPSLTANGSAIKLEFTPARGDAKVMGVPEQIQQVLLNLVQNSVKALQGRQDGLIHVSVEAEGLGQDREVSATVVDNGCGIKREHLEKLFIPFFTTSPS